MAVVHQAEYDKFLIHIQNEWQEIWANAHKTRKNL